MNGRSIQDIVPPARNRPLRPMGSSVQPTRPPILRDNQDSRGGGGWKYLLFGIAGVFVVVGLVIAIMSTVFHSAIIKATISEWKVDASSSYTAGSGTPLTYQIISYEDTASVTVPASGTASSEDRAFGTVTITNNYSAKEQRLITNTRFLSADGKTFRIHEPVVVPGIKTVDGTKIPGTATVTIYADQPGPEYNIPAGSFTIPGLKGTPQYKDITTVSTEAFVGGFIGTRAVVDKVAREQALSELRAELDRRVQENIRKEVPAGSVFFPGSVELNFTEQPDVTTDQKSVTLSVKVSAIAPAFVEEELSRAVASVGTVSFTDPLTLVNPSELVYTSTSRATASSTTFTLAGIAHIIADFDPSAFATAVAGHDAAAVDRDRTKFTGLTGAVTVEIYPFWLQSIPTSKSAIKVETRGSLDQ